MKSRFVRPEICVLTISQGDTLAVKRRLSSGERRAMFASLYRETTDGMLHVNPLQVGLAMVLAYLVDWTLRDETGQIVPIARQPESVVRAALDALDVEAFAEIRSAIEAHAEAMDAERSAEKNATDGENKSSVTSPSPSAVTGGTSG